MPHLYRLKQLPLTQTVTLIFLLFLAGTTAAQTRIHRSLTPTEGLIQSQVISLHEDHEGYLWIGTFGGLSRWDGRTFRNFNQSHGMGHKEVQSIAESSDGTLYFATKGGGVSIWKNDQFTVLNMEDGLPNNTCRAVVMMPGGDVAVGTDAGVCLIRNGKVISPAEDSGLKDILVVNLAVTSTGILHVATWGDGLITAAGEPLKVTGKITDLPVEKIRALTIGPDDQVYFVPAGSGIYTLNNGQATPFPDDPTSGQHEIVTLFVRGDGTLLAGSQQHGVIMWRPDHSDFLDKSNGLASNTVYAFSEGRDGLLFLGTWGGVSIFEQDRIITVSEADGLSQNIVTCINFSPEDDSIYFGFPDQGIQKYENGVLITLAGTTHEALHQVWVVHENEDGSLLIGSDYGVHRYHSGDLREMSAVDKTKLRSVQSIITTADGGLTIMDMHGLFRLEGDSLVPVFRNQDTGINKANDVLEVGIDEYLLATINGVFKISGKYPDASVEPYEPLSELEHSTVWALHKLDNGMILLGTNEKGLAIFTPGEQGHSDKLRYLDASSGLSDNTVLAIATDQDGDIYLSTNKGVNVVQPRGPRWPITHLDHQDGLGSDECVQGALAISPQGHLWVGTIGGASRYDKNHDQTGSQPPLLKMNKFSIFDQEVSLDEFASQPVFNYQDNYLKIEFTGIHLPRPDEVFYRYRMSSVDQDWVQSQRQYVQYTNLAPGSYQFEISANLPEGSNSEIQVWRFTIKPPFWRTWWFILLSVIVVGGSAGLIISFRVRQLLALERLRTRIAADLHDDIGSGLTEISIVSSLISHKLPPEASAGIDGDLQRIGDTSRRLITSMSDIVWLVNPSLDSLFDLLAKLGESSAELLSARGIRFEDINLDSLQKVRLPMEHRRQLLLIFKEAVSNAVKYSGADFVRLEARCQRNELRIILTDNGGGFDQEDVVPQGSGNGLKNMKTRAEKIRGQLKIESSKGQGTQIIFIGPAR